MQGRNRAASTLNSQQWTPDPALNTTIRWTCFAMKIRSACAWCVASKDTRDIVCSDHRKRGGRDRYVMDTVNISRVISSVLFVVLFMLLLMYEMNCK